MVALALACLNLLICGISLKDSSFKRSLIIILLNGPEPLTFLISIDFSEATFLAKGEINILSLFIYSKLGFEVNFLIII